MVDTDLHTLRHLVRMFALEHGVSNSTVKACNEIDVRAKSIINRRDSDREDRSAKKNQGAHQHRLALQERV